MGENPLACFVFRNFLNNILFFKFRYRNFSPFPTYERVYGIAVAFSEFVFLSISNLIFSPFNFPSPEKYLEFF